MALDANLLKYNRFKIWIAGKRLVECCCADSIRVDLRWFQHRPFTHDIIGDDQAALP